MKYSLYTTSKRAWKAMFQAIREAQKSIYLEMYVFLPDTISTYDFFGALKAKALAGVKVVVIADAAGSPKIAPQIKELRSAGVEFIFFSHWLRRTHKKILIVDEKVGFLGGVNIKQSYAGWQDLQIKISGRLVKMLLKSFAHTYALCHGKDRRILEYRQKSFLGRVNFWFLEHSPIRGVYGLRRYYQDKINQAIKSIVMVTPYFTPPRWLIAVLDDAVRRGVEVKVIVPEHTDIPFISRINYFYFAKLASLGIKFYLVNKMNHAKVFVIDDTEALIGSQNIDFLSFRLNTEIGLFSRDKELLFDLSKIINSWLKGSMIYQQQNFRPNFFDYLFAGFFKLFRPLL